MSKPLFERDEPAENGSAYKFSWGHETGWYFASEMISTILRLNLFKVEASSLYRYWPEPKAHYFPKFSGTCNGFQKWKTNSNCYAPFHKLNIVVDLLAEMRAPGSKMGARTRIKLVKCYSSSM